MKKKNDADRTKSRRRSGATTYPLPRGVSGCCCRLLFLLIQLLPPRLLKIAAPRRR